MLLRRDSVHRHPRHSAAAAWMLSPAANMYSGLRLGLSCLVPVTDATITPRVPTGSRLGLDLVLT